MRFFEIGKNFFFVFFFLSLLHNWILFHLFMDQSHKILSLIFSIANGKCTCNRVGCLFPEILSTNLSLFSSEMKRVFKKLKFSVRFRPNRQFRFGSTRSEGFGFLIKQNKMKRFSLKWLGFVNSYSKTIGQLYWHQNWAKEILVVYVEHCFSHQ